MKKKEKEGKTITPDHLDDDSLRKIAWNIRRLTADDHWSAAVFIGATRWNPEWMEHDERMEFHQRMGFDFYRRWRRGEFPMIIVVKKSHSPALYRLRQPDE